MHLSETLTHQQKRFCDEYLVSFNAYRAALAAGYSENTARKGQLLHLPEVEAYLKNAMNKTALRLEITHDMILRELAKVAFSSMGNYYDDRGVLKSIYELTEDEKACLSHYEVLDATDDNGQRVGTLSKIRLHNKMAALEKIARHLNFYGLKKEAGSQMQVAGCFEHKEEETQELRSSNQEKIETDGYIDENYRWVEVAAKESEKEEIEQDAGSVKIEAEDTELIMRVAADGCLTIDDTEAEGKKILTFSPLKTEAESKVNGAGSSVRFLLKTS